MKNETPNSKRINISSNSKVENFVYFESKVKDFIQNYIDKTLKEISTIREDMKVSQFKFQMYHLIPLMFERLAGDDLIHSPRKDRSKGGVPVEDTPEDNPLTVNSGNHSPQNSGTTVKALEDTPKESPLTLDTPDERVTPDFESRASGTHGPSGVGSPCSSLLNKRREGKPEGRMTSFSRNNSPSGNHGQQTKPIVRHGKTVKLSLTDDSGLDKTAGTHDNLCDCQLCSDVRKLHLGTTKNKSQEKCGGSDKIGCAKCGIYNICKKCKQWAQVNKDRLCGGCDNQNHTNCPYTGKKGYVPEEECHCFCCGTHKGSGNQNQDCANKEMKK